MLEAHGIHLAFSPTGGADFSGITKAEGLHIEHVIQDALVSTDEDGTEATAATAVALADGGADSGPVKVIQLDVTRLFLIVIHDFATKTVLFAGRVTDPSG